LGALLKKKGLTLVSAQKTGEKKGMDIKLPDFLRSVGVVDKMLFTRNLAVMLRAGLSFSRALGILAEQTKSSYFREILQAVEADVQKGSALADSLQKYPKVFNRLFVSMVRVGEAGGNLEEVLEMLSIQLKKDYEITSKVRGAMMYPCVILAAMSLIGILMMTFVFPSLLKMFSESKADLPVTTKALIFISDALQYYGLFIFIG
jgi:type IV pilus assembly protein PilC